jgi:hypothetical protein
LRPLRAVSKNEGKFIEILFNIIDYY